MTGWQPGRHAARVAAVSLEGLVPDLVEAVAARTAHIVEALRALGEEALRSPSELPGWTVLTIACHLRYGSEALVRMTRATLAGEAVSYYPDGRPRQRPRTLLPREGERPSDVVSALARHSQELQEAWSALSGDAWRLEVMEPEDHPDLGSLVLARLPLLRLTELEVHGTDLGLGLEDWSGLFVSVSLPFRLDWLNTRRSNHREVDDRVHGSWLLVASDGPSYLVSVTGGEVRSHPASPASTATAVIEGTSRDLLALLLGRSCNSPLKYAGDVAFGWAFGRAFPGP
jgi:maleylpyruvate isomerase